MSIFGSPLILDSLFINSGFSSACGVLCSGSDFLSVPFIIKLVLRVHPSKYVFF